MDVAQAIVVPWAECDQKPRAHLLTMSSALKNEMLDTGKIETLIFGGFCIGGSLLITHLVFGKSAKKAGGRVEKVFVEFQRKAFHMIGGCIICVCYHWGIKHQVLKPAYLGDSESTASTGMDAGAAFLAVSLVCWVIEAARLCVPSVQAWYLKTFKGLIRQKEHNKAAGIAYFLPGALAAMLAAPSNFAILGILFLSVGDAAASIGTAFGYIPVFNSARKVEGSIGCFTVCLALAVHAGLSPGVSLIASVFVTLGEVLAEIIGLDDNFVIPMLGVLGVRIGLYPQLGQMAGVVCVGLGLGVGLAAIVGATTAKESK